MQVHKHTLTLISAHTFRHVTSYEGVHLFTQGLYLFNRGGLLIFTAAILWFLSAWVVSNSNSFQWHFTFRAPITVWKSTRLFSDGVDPTQIIDLTQHFVLCGRFYREQTKVPYCHHLFPHHFRSLRFDWYVISLHALLLQWFNGLTCLQDWRHPLLISMCPTGWNCMMIIFIFIYRFDRNSV